MTKIARLFFSASFLFLLSAPAMAEDIAAQPTPVSAEPVSEPAVNASTTAAEEPAAPSCAQVAEQEQASTSVLSAFYATQPSTITKDADSLKIDQAQGAMVINGITYKLQSVEIPKVPAIPISSVQYPMEVRFIHAAADGSSAVLSVPVSAGKPNLALETMLDNPQAATVNPNDFLPAKRDYASTGRSFGTDCSPAQTVQHFLLTQPVEASTAQIEKFEQLF